MFHWLNTLDMNIVPVRIDVELEGYHFQDTFTWISPIDNNLIETFVDQLCHDFELSPQIMKGQLMKTIKEQIVDFNTYNTSSGKFALPSELKNIRIIIICDLIWLADQFEWEPFNARNVAEDFAYVYCNELRLPGEFKSAVAHAIREQSFLFLKALLTTGYRVDPSNGNIQFNDNEVAECAITNSNGFSQKNRLLRTPDLVDFFTPKIVNLTEDELEKLSYSRKRENRSKKRSTFSVSSPPKIHRTFLGYKGSVNRSAASSDYDDDGNLDKKQTSSRRTARKGVGHSMNVNAASSALCNFCDNTVYSSDQGICTKCGNIVTQIDSARLSADSSVHSKITGGTQKQQPSEKTTTGAKRGRKPLPTTQVSYPIPVPEGPKQDLEPLSEPLQKLLPEWLEVARKKLDEKYQLDLFSVIFEDDEPRMKCHECSKIYYVGPGQTLNNFETHLKNRTHRGNVDWRLEHPEENEEPAEMGITQVEHLAHDSNKLNDS